MVDITTIQVMKNTRDRLLEIGMKKETYDDLINRLIDFYLSAKRESIERRESRESIENIESADKEVLPGESNKSNIKKKGR